MTDRPDFRAERRAPAPCRSLPAVLRSWLSPALGGVLRPAGLALLASLLPLSAPAAAPAAAAEVVSLCFERVDVLPWRTANGGGLNFELLKMVEQRANVRFDYQGMPWKRCLAQIKDNAVDGVFAISYKPDRHDVGEYPGGQQIDIGKRMHIDRYVLLRRKGSPVEWDGKSFRNLDGAIGFQLGYSVGDVLRAQHVEVDEGSQRSDELARKLLAGRIAAAAMGGSDAAVLMHGPLAPQLEQLPAPIIEKPYFLMLSHALVAARPQLAERIWRALEEARNSPAYKKLEHSEGARH